MFDTILEKIKITRTDILVKKNNGFFNIFLLRRIKPYFVKNKLGFVNKYNFDARRNKSNFNPKKIIDFLTNKKALKMVL